MKFGSDFKKFITRGNVVDLAIGFTVGAAFTIVVKSLVSDIIMPPLSVMLGGASFSDKFILLRSGADRATSYATLEQAQAAGAVTLNYGLFIDSFIALLIVGLAMYFIIRTVSRIDERLERDLGIGREKQKEPADKKCPHCLSTIPYRATRCAHCTSQLQGV